MLNTLMQKWGEDHWETFATVARRCAEGGAKGFDTANGRMLSTDPARHPKQSGDRVTSGPDDWDRLRDLESAGLVELFGDGDFPTVFLASQKPPDPAEFVDREALILLLDEMESRRMASGIERRLAKALGIVPSAKHGSWKNPA